MKNTIYIMVFAAILAVSCQSSGLEEDGVNENSQHLKTLTAGAEDRSDTRVGFDENNAFY